MRRYLLLLSLLLAACAPAPVALQPVDVEQAQAVIYSATSTARVVATQAAVATASRVSTLQALDGQQTQVSLAITQAEGERRLGEANAQSTRSMAETQVWGTPTAAVARAELAAALAERQARVERARQSVDTAQYAGWTLLLLLAVLVVITAYYYERWLSLRHDARAALRDLELQRAYAEMVRTMAIIIAGQHYWPSAEGYVPLLPTPASTPAPAPDGREQRWRDAARRLVEHGLSVGSFAERDLAQFVTHGNGAENWSGLRRLRRLLENAGVWGIYGRGMTWAAGWGAERFAAEWDTHPLPQLPDGDPPAVSVPVAIAQS